MEPTNRIKGFAAHFITALALGALLTLPFGLLEWVNRRDYQEDYPFGLFGLLWGLSSGVVLLLRAIVSDLREKSFKVQPFSFALRVILQMALGWAWLSTLVDQMPCFMGVPLCD